MANVLLGIHCVVPGCMSTLKRVNQWKAKPCGKPKHKGKTHAHCMCPEPFQFFKFPAEVKLQKLWLERVKRPDLEVNNLTRVCSLHFVEGRPTRRNYFPNANLYQQEDEAENEEEEMEEQQFYDEDDADDDMQEASSSASPQKKGRSGTVSIVPMELLQEQGEDDGVDEQAGEEDYEGNLTISRFNYQENQEEAYEIPTNSVTITRVTSIAPSAPCTKPSNRFINTKKTRVESLTAAGNRFLKERGVPIVTASSSVNLPRNNNNGRSQSVVAPSRAPILARPKNNGNNLLRTSTGGRTKVQVPQTHEEDNNCSYEVDMLADEVDDDDDGDSSELSDIGIDIKPPSATKPKYTNRDISTAKTLSSLVVVSRQHSVPPQKEQAQVVKPKLIPVLAVAPKSQHQQQGQHQLQPIQVTTRTVPAPNLIPQQNKKPINTNVIVATSSAKPVVTTSATGNPIKTVIAVAGSSSSMKTEPTTTAPVNIASALTNSSGNNAGQQKPAAPTLATYDPSKQQLQIADPVKYIQECHMRIAQLLAEKQNLETRNNELEGKVQELQKSNNDLRREIVHQALNAARRAPQPMNTPTFSFLPTAIADSASSSSSTENQNGNGSLENSNNSNGSTSGNKQTRTIRYVIRRPANLTSATNSTK